MIELITTIHEVTVFKNHARMTRHGDITLEPGRQQIAIHNLPLSIDPASVRTRAKGSAKAKILGVDVRKSYFKETPPGRALDLIEQIRKLQDEDRDWLDQLETQDKLIAHFDGLAENTKTFASGLSRGRTTIETHQALLEFITERRLGLQAKKRSIDQHRREITSEIEKTKKELQQIQAAQPKERYSALVELDVAQGGELQIALSYLQSGAGWEPVYDIRLNDSELEITYLGQVSQSSGEDWNGIPLTLSTVSPGLAGIVPELQPWFIAPIQPMVTRAKGGVVSASLAPQALQAAAPSPAEAAAFGAGEAMEEVAHSQAEIHEHGASVTFKIGNGIDIPGDNTPHKTTIAQFSLPIQSDYVTAPRLVNAAYRRIKVENDSPYMLLPGQVQLFEGEDFIGVSGLERIVPGQEIEFYFGVDDRIRVERELTKRDTDKKLLGDQRRIRYAYEIRLENHTRSNQTIHVWDQIPVSRHENLKVHLSNSNPKVAQQDELNRLEWKLEMPSGSKQTVQYEFNVEFPRDMQVAGLP